MSAQFVPLFPQLTSAKNSAQEKFNLYASPQQSQEAAPGPAPTGDQPKISTVTLVPRERPKSAGKSKSQLKSKLLSDLKQAVALSLPPEVIQQIVRSLEELKSANQADQAAETKAPGTPSAPGNPHVSIQKDGDQVTQIIVECGCGEMIALDCIY